MILIRQAIIEDASAMSELSGQLGYPRTIAETQRALSQLMLTDTACVKVACEGETVVAWASAHRQWWIESGEQFELTGLIVRESFRRSGIGRLLVHDLERWVIDCGGRSLRVRSNIQRVASHPFYAQLGFTQIKSQHVYQKILTNHLAKLPNPS